MANVMKKAMLVADKVNMKIQMDSAKTVYQDVLHAHLLQYALLVMIILLQLMDSVYASLTTTSLLVQHLATFIFTYLILFGI